jgi:hypothetical protein
VELQERGDVWGRKKVKMRPAEEAWLCRDRGPKVLGDEHRVVQLGYVTSMPRVCSARGATDIPAPSTILTNALVRGLKLYL